MNNAFLIGAGVYLRPMEKGDATAFAAWLNDAEVNRTLLRAHPLSIAAEEDYLDRVSRSDTDVALSIVVRETDRLIGATGLHDIEPRARHACFGIFIGARQEWGKGYGTEATALVVGHAFATMNLNRVWLHVLAGHERGIRAYERVGFRAEGVLRQHLYREGRYQDLVTMGLLRQEWDARR